MRTYLREAYLLPLTVCAPVILVLIAMKRWFVPHGYGQLAVHLAVAGTVYAVALFWAFSSKRAMQVGQLHSPGMALESPQPMIETHSHEI